MDVNQLIIAIIGASSTLLAALLGSRSRQKPGVTPTKRSARKTLIKFAIYFLLGGAATYWAMNWLLPFGRIDERLSTLESHTQSLMQRLGGFGFVQTSDSVAPPSLPVGSLILSVLPPDRFAKLPDASGHWAPADGRTLDSLSRYVVLTGDHQAPDLRAIQTGLTATDSTAVNDHMRHRTMSGIVQGSDTTRGSAFYWYVRIN